MRVRTLFIFLYSGQHRDNIVFKEYNAPLTKGEIIRDSPLIPIIDSLSAYFLTWAEAFATTCSLLCERATKRLR